MPPSGETTYQHAAAAAADTRRIGISLDPLELKALSVPRALLFMLGAEYDIFRCCGNGPIVLRFPFLGPNFRKLLQFCAERFSLGCSHEDRTSVVSGTPRIPVLRYADFVPGRLHVDELLAIFGTAPAASPRREGNEYAAAFIPYDDYASDESLTDVHGLGFYLALEYGLSLATHAHLVRLLVRRGRDPQEAVIQFRNFSGWRQFDLRFEDATRATAVIVMPTVQDAADLLEKYEDEDSEDDVDDDPLLFSLRPVASQVAVPAVEDAQLRRLRAQHWDKIEAFWRTFERSRNTVVVSNLYSWAKLTDIVKLFESLSITESSMVCDDSPYRRTRVFITFASSGDARQALALDGKNTHGKALRVQVSPPYIDVSRRGRPVTAESSAATTPEETPKRGASPVGQEHHAGSGRGGARSSGTSPPPTAAAMGSKRQQRQQPAGAPPSSGGKKPATGEAPPKKAPAGGAAAAGGAKAAAAAKPSREGPMPAGEAPKAPSPIEPAATTEQGQTAPEAHVDTLPKGKSFGMNVAAKEFIPRFSPKLAPTAAPMGVDAPGVMLSPPPYAAPPPPLPPPPPPPPYQVSPPMYGGTSPSFPALPGGTSPLLSGSFHHGGAALPPPAYQLPPPGPPPAYGVVTPPNGSFGSGDAGLPLPPPPPYGSGPAPSHAGVFPPPPPPYK